MVFYLRIALVIQGVFFPYFCESLGFLWRLSQFCGLGTMLIAIILILSIHKQGMSFNLLCLSSEIKRFLCKDDSPPLLGLFLDISEAIRNEFFHDLSYFVMWSRNTTNFCDYSLTCHFGKSVDHF